METPDLPKKPSLMKSKDRKIWALQQSGIEKEQQNIRNEYLKTRKALEDINLLITSLVKKISELSNNKEEPNYELVFGINHSQLEKANNEQKELEIELQSLIALMTDESKKILEIKV